MDITLEDRLNRKDVKRRKVSLKSLPSRFKMNDKEKIRETLRMLDDLERFADHLDGQLTWMTTKELKKSLQKIRDVLES